MATMTLSTQDILKMVNNLIEVDYSAVDAYNAAIDRLDDPSTKAELRGFLGDHQRHTVELSAYVREIGGTPPTEADYRHMLTKGKVVLASIVGDRGVLSAMKSNEDDTNKAYEEAVNRGGVPERLHELLKGNLADERRHRAWIQDRLSEEKAAHSRP